jgi:uncharacterized membrane protein HdeD (DUF308 family)
MNGIDDPTASGPVTVVETFRLNWWLLALRGLIAVVFGVLAFIWPNATLITLVLFFGAFALVNGILSLILAAKTSKGYPKVGSLILGGILGILAGLLTFVIPGVTALGLLILIAAWAIVTGVMELVAAVRLRKIVTNEWLLMLAGIASIAFGVILLLQPAAGALALIWLIATWAVCVRNSADRPRVSDAKLEGLYRDPNHGLRAGQRRLQVRIQTRWTTSRFLTGISFIFCGASSSCAVEVMKVPTPHREKQSKTIAIFVNKFTD